MDVDAARKNFHGNISDQDYMSETMCSMVKDLRLLLLQKHACSIQRAWGTIRVYWRIVKALQRTVQGCIVHAWYTQQVSQPFISLDVELRLCP